MTDRDWKLGRDLYPEDSLLDGITFADLILALHCDCPVIDLDAVVTEYTHLLMAHMDDANELLRRNLDEIITAAMEGREEV